MVSWAWVGLSSFTKSSVNNRKIRPGCGAVLLVQDPPKRCLIALASFLALWVGGLMGQKVREFGRIKGSSNSVHHAFTDSEANQLIP